MNGWLDVPICTRPFQYAELSSLNCICSAHTRINHTEHYAAPDERGAQPHRNPHHRPQRHVDHLRWQEPHSLPGRRGMPHVLRCNCVDIKLHPTQVLPAKGRATSGRAAQLLAAFNSPHMHAAAAMHPPHGVYSFWMSRFLSQQQEESSLQGLGHRACGLPFQGGTSQWAPHPWGHPLTCPLT